MRWWNYNMEIGKLPNSILSELIINTLKPKRDEVLIRPDIGEDCTAFELDKDVCVMSTDPITGATKNLGKLAVDISLNDIASCGATPFGIMITIMIPPKGTVSQLKEIMGDINKRCNQLNIDVLGGHTEVTDAVTRFVIVSTAIGRVKKEKLVTTKGALENDVILMTKFAGLEGTSIIINEREKQLQKSLSVNQINEGKDLINSIGVIKEGIIAGECLVNSMHDITEGGVLGAIWEVCQSCKLGATIYADKIPIKEITQKICDIYNINPLKLISSGSMLITCNELTANILIDKLKKEKINCTKIGIITKKDMVLVDKKNKVIINEPSTDELYKVIKNGN